jgi:hypothetical protein
MYLEQARIIELSKIEDQRGHLSVIENGGAIPFDIARCYWIYDVPSGERRGEGHAFRQTDELIIAISGAFEVTVDDGRKRYQFALNRPFNGLYVPRTTWREMHDFSTNSVALVLSSLPYDEEDYIYDYHEFKALRR